MKVSPEYFIQLCQRVKILQGGKGKGKRYIRAHVKGTGKIVVIEVQVKRTGEIYY